MFKMSAIVTLIAISVQIQMVSGIGNDTIKMKVKKGETVVLQCSTSEGDQSWLGPDVINLAQKELVYFLKNKLNPTLNQAEYLLVANNGSYDLKIVNFRKKNTGCYKCRFENNGPFREMRYNVYLTDNENETTTRTFTGGSFRNTSSITIIAKTTYFQIPNDLQGNSEKILIFLLVMIPIVLLGGSITIVGVLARVKRTSFGEMLRSVLSLCQRDTERHATNEEINEQDNTVENQMYQNSNVPPNGNSSETEIPFPERTDRDADLGVSVDTGATSNYRNTDESTAVKIVEKMQPPQHLFNMNPYLECTSELHYAEVLIKPVDSQQIKIHGIENRTIYTGIDHSLKRGAGQSNHSDNESKDDFIVIQNQDDSSQNYENTCL